MSSSIHERIPNEQVHEPRVRRVRRRRRKRGFFVRLIEWLIVLVALAAIVAALAALAVLIGERELGRRIYPNISIRGVAIGGLTPTDARAALERAYGEFLYAPVEIEAGGRVWRPAPEALGLSLELDHAVGEAFAFGRAETRAEQAQLAAATWQYGLDLPLHLRFDQQVAQQYLMQIARAVETPPQDANLTLEGTQIIVQPERWGTQVLVDETLADLTAAVQGLQRETIVVRTRLLEPRVRDADVAPFAVELATILQGPVTIEAASPTCADECRWTLPIEQIATWITLRRIETADGKPSFVLGLDPAPMRAALLPLATAVREPGTLPTVAWNGGDLRIVTPGQSGRGLDAEAALAELRAALFREERSFTLPMVATPPPVTASNLAALGITERVGMGISSFSRSEQYRITNIRAGARRMHNVLIPPGATFSFNQQLGPVNASTGFVEGLAIVNNRTQKEWGGGLCQVSTTVFRAAFFGGLPITERHSHAFRIGWYEELGEPPGLDAAIFTPYNDVRFVNDTGGWLLMESYVDLERQRLTVVLYGSSTGRKVTYTHQVLERMPAPTKPVYVDDPQFPRGYLRRSDTARGGIKVEVYRTVTRDGQVIARDTFPTLFKPWPDIYVRGTGR
ncbi:MAG: VanW family protein [Oscillochloridaceae bacterium umkhey_bin13]